MIKIKEVTVELNRQELSDLLSTAINGISYWADVSYNENDYEMAKNELISYDKLNEDDICYEDVLAKLLMDGKEITIIDYEEDDFYKLTKDQIENGVSKTILNFPEYIEENNQDAEYGDILIQYACFDDVVYG